MIETSKVEESEKYDDCEGSNLSDNTCRICFRTHSNPFDPLLSLCKCSGTMGLTHLNCLQKWVFSKSLKKINSHCITYTWKTIDCDICQKSLPLSFVYENKEYSLIKVPRPCEKFVMLEDMRKEKFRFMIHVITPEFAPVVIGRSSDCDLRINDISVSSFARKWIHSFTHLCPFASYSAATCFKLSRAKQRLEWSI